MLKQVTNQVLVSYDDTHNGRNHKFISDNLEQAVNKAMSLMRHTKSGNVVIKSMLTEEVLDYFEK